MRWKANLKYGYKSCKSRLLSKALSKLTKGINALRREIKEANLHFTTHTPEKETQLTFCNGAMNVLVFEQYH